MPLRTRIRVNMTKASVRDKILVLLKKHPRGLTIMEISNILGKNRLTISKYVYGLTIEGLIRQKEIGTAKVCFINKKSK